MSMTSPSDQRPAWVVVSQVPGPGADRTGQLSQGYTITIQTAAGHQGRQFVSDAEYTPAQVRPLLADLAARLDQIGGLSG